ncbi:MAG: glutaredoxin [bacterium]
MSQPEITAYLKTSCGWSKGVRAIMDKYSLSYTDKDIIQNPSYRFEMEQRSGQPLSPCVEINGVMLPDISGEEVEAYLLAQKLVSPNGATTDVPLNAACSDEQHAAMVAGAVKMKF